MKKYLFLFFVIFSLGLPKAFGAKGVIVKKLETGQLLMVSEDKTLPICYVYAIVRGGNIWDPPQYEGLAHLMGNMLLRGTLTRTREQIQDELDQLGADISISVGAESMMVLGQTLKKNLEPFLSIFSDVILNPSFDEKELGKEKREEIADLKEMRQNDQALAKRFFKKALFDTHPYGKHAEGKESTIQKISRKEVQSLYKKFFYRENFFFAATGDVSQENLSQNLTRYFSKVSKGEALSYPYPKDLKDKGGLKIVLIDKPKRTQTQIILGHVGIQVNHPDFFPLLIANNAFGGGGFSTRLMDEVRVKRGWSYGAYSWFQPMIKPGEFAMWVFPAAKDTVDTLKLVLSLYQEYAQKGITQAEFDLSKSNLINEFAFKIDTAKRRVGQLITIELFGLPKDYLDTYQEKLRKVTLEEVNRAIQQYSDPKNITIAMVCTASEFKNKLSKEFGKNMRIQVKSYKTD